MRKFTLAAALLLFGSLSFISCNKKDAENIQVKTIDFENLNFGSSGYWNGADLTAIIGSPGMTFINLYNPTYSSWAGFAYSQKADITTPGYGNQFSVFDGTNGLNKFAIYYPPFGEDAFAFFPGGAEKKMRSLEVCNSTYAALSMKNGDNYAKKFGGTSGNDKDWFKMTVIGYSAEGDSISNVEFYLADYRSTNNSADYILNKWTPVDLTGLGKVNKITFRFSSSDNGTFGMNTPSIVCIDDLKYEEVISNQ